MPAPAQTPDLEVSTIEPENLETSAAAIPHDITLVSFNGPDDPEHPHNWSPWTKVLFVLIVSAKIFVVSFASSVFGAANSALAEEYGASQTVLQLGVALFIAGFALGPLVFGPLSEVIGNSPPMIFGCLACALLQIPLALAQDMPTILVSRFLAGATGSAVLGVGTGMVAELFEAIPRAAALAFSVSMINLGSTVGPTAGSYIVERYGWRWTAWVTFIMFLALEPIAFFTLRESSPNKILVVKSKRIRARDSSKSHVLAPLEAEKIDIHALVTKYLSKPLRLFYQEPILVILTVHLTFVYGLLYLAYQLIPLSFQRRGWSASESSLPFIAVTLGVLSAPAVIITFTMTWFKRRYNERQGVIIPEDRLPPMILGAAILPLSLIWFGWSMSTHWICQVLPAYFLGLAVVLIFNSGILYMVDVYPTCANSAVSIHVVFRSLVTASFPLWTYPLYEALSTEWMSTVLTAVAAILLLFPIILLFFGKKVRSWSKYTD